MRPRIAGLDGTLTWTVNVHDALIVNVHDALVLATQFRVWGVEIKGLRA